MSRLGRGFPNNALMHQMLIPLPVAYDATGGGSGVVGTSTSWTHNIAANAVTLSGYLQATNTTAVPTANVGGTSMTLLGVSPKYGPTAGYYFWSFIFGLLNPPTGNQTITISASTAAAVGANSVSYKNVGSFGTFTSTQGTSSAPVLSVPSAPGQMVVETFATWSTNPSGYTQTSRYTQNVNSPARGLLVGDAPGASTVSFSASSCDEWTAAAVPLLPA